MEDRIQVNGVWYVREQEEQSPEVEINIMRSEARSIESDKYFFEAIRLERPDAPGTYFEDIDIKLTDKRERPWKEDFWDNNAWFRGVLINDPESMKHLRESVCLQGEAEFKAFLKELKREGWI
jgi:uncharacterized protein YegJ (DUF2314 family)